MYIFPVKLKHYKTTALIIITGMAALTWTPSYAGKNSTRQNTKDTIPVQQPNQNNTEGSKDIDERLLQLEKAMEHVERQLKQKDWDKIQRQVEASLSKVNLDKIQQQLEAAIKSIDLDKIRLETEAALKNIDLEKIRSEIKSAIAQVTDKTKWKELDTELNQALKEAQKSIEETKKIDFEKIKKELQQTKIEWQEERKRIEKDLQEAREEIKNDKTRIQDELGKAKEEISKAKDELQGYKTMISEMETAGLLNTSADYSIEYKGNELFINGRKQTNEVTDKYKRYFKKENTSIRKVKGNFSIDNDTEN